MLATRWFPATDGVGALVLRDVPPGEYRVRVLLPDEKTLAGQVTVVAGRTTHVAFEP